MYMYIYTHTHTHTHIYIYSRQEFCSTNKIENTVSLTLKLHSPMVLNFCHFILDKHIKLILKFDLTLD